MPQLCKHLPEGSVVMIDLPEQNGDFPSYLVKSDVFVSTSQVVSEQIYLCGESRSLERHPKIAAIVAIVWGRPWIPTVGAMARPYEAGSKWGVFWAKIQMKGTVSLWVCGYETDTSYL